MSRKLRTTVPTTEDQRKPKTPDFSVVALKYKRLKTRQKVNHDTHCGARKLPVLSTWRVCVGDGPRGVRRSS